jgi:hypothetical protein
MAEDRWWKDLDAVVAAMLVGGSRTTSGAAMGDWSTV